MACKLLVILVRIGAPNRWVVRPYWPKNKNIFYSIDAGRVT